MKQRLLWSALALVTVAAVGCGDTNHSVEASASIPDAKPPASNVPAPVAEPATPNASFGRFIGTVVTEWLPDGRRMRLVEPFAYISPSNQRWDAPKDSKIDGASIPRVAWSLIGGPFEGRYREASVIHDVACQEEDRPWQDAHLAFYTAMRTSGVDPAMAKLMYGAVYIGGPRWNRTVTISVAPGPNAKGRLDNAIAAQQRRGEYVGTPVGPDRSERALTAQVIFAPEEFPKELTEADLKELQAAIEAQDLSLQQIEQFKFQNPPRTY